MRYTVSIPQFETWFLATPAGQELIAAEEKKLHERREQLARDFTAAEREYEARHAEFGPAIRAAEAKKEAAKKAFDEAIKEHCTVYQHAQGQATLRERRLEQIRQEMATLLPVDLQAVRDRIDTLRAAAQTSTEALALDALREEVATLTFIPAAALEKRLTKIRQANPSLAAS